ncbi:MAG: hypothetical protein K0Q49_2058 [Haloplasmataceae bacterium]|jgi:3-methyladenine DNA glycosylase AlkD|nr:hypothetical protein [Haloplasmataceae bacterium]
MTKTDVMSYLESHGNMQTKRIYMSHGASEPLFGVKLTDLKSLKKEIKTDHNLAIELFDTGNSDAMYLAGLIADPKLVTVEFLNDWIKKANWNMLSDRSVAVLAAKSPYGFEVARHWLKSDVELVVCAGFSIYSTMFSFTDDFKINLDEVKELLDYIGINIHSQSQRIQNAMNNFVIMAGIYILPIYEDAYLISKKVGKIQPMIAENDCNTQTATDYLVKYKEKGKIGVKIKNLSR